MKANPKSRLLDDHCCLCGQKKCNQSTDHNYTSFGTFKSNIQNAKMPNKILDQIKSKINTFYYQLRYQIQCLMDRDLRMITQHVDKYYYLHLQENKQITGDLYQYANGCYNKLPSKSVYKLINKIQQIKAGNSSHLFKQAEEQIFQLKNCLDKFLKQFSKHKICQKLINILPYTNLVQKKTPKIPQLKLKKSTSDVSNPQEVESPLTHSYTWKNFQIRPRTKIIQLNNKGITDEQLIKQIPKLAAYKNVQQFQIRNNKITSFICKVLAINLLHIKSIDIRGNKIGDQGVIQLVKGLPQLKGLMISQTGCTNLSLKCILQKLPLIQKLWCEQNNIDENYVLDIANLPNLKMLSLANCKLGPDIAEKIKKIFSVKGYASI